MMRQNNRNKLAWGVILMSCLCLLLIMTAPAYADDGTAPITTPTPTVDYKLPYPGLLPDSPLYFLKSFRDNLMGFFIGKPLEKADFLLLQSDKQVAASAMLVSQNKINLATTTFAQGQAYFEDAIEQTEAAKKEGLGTDDMTKKLVDANSKHFQILNQMNQEIVAADQKKLDDARNRENEFAKRVKSMLHK